MGYDASDFAITNPQYDVDLLINQVSQQYGVDPVLVRAVIRQESNFDPRAVSHRGATGLMQLMAPTAGDYGLTPEDRFDPKKNVDAGVRHLKRLLGRYQGDEKMALAAYNAGEGNVAKYKGIPPFKETQDYVTSVLAHRQAYMDEYAAKAPGRDPTEALPPKVAGRAMHPAGIDASDFEITQPKNKSGSPLVGSRRFIEQMMEGGAQPAMMDVPAKTKKPWNYKTPWAEQDKVYDAQYPVVVDSVYDADTVYVHYLHDDPGSSFPVRFYDIDAPELKDSEGNYLPEGVEARNAVKNLVGKTLILNRPVNPETGAHGRELGKLYTRKAGYTIDLSKPDIKGIEKEKPTGWLKGTGASVLKDAVDLMDFMMWGGDMMLPGDPFKNARAWVNENLHSPLDEVRVDFLSGANSKNMVNLPYFGPVSTSELARVGAITFAELLGVDLLFGGLGKGSKAVAALAKAADASNAKDIGKFKKTVSIIDEIEQAAGVQSKIDESGKKLMRTLHPEDEHVTTAQYMATFWDRFLYHFSEKERGITKLARMLGDEKLMDSIGRHRAAQDIATGPLYLGTGYWDADIGKWIDTYSREGLSSLMDIVNGLPNKVVREAMLYLTTKREIFDLLPRWNAALRKAAEELQTGYQMAKGHKKGIRRPELNEDLVKQRGIDVAERDLEERLAKWRADDLAPQKADYLDDQGKFDKPMWRGARKKYQEKLMARARKILGWDRNLDYDALKEARQAMINLEIKYKSGGAKGWYQFNKLGKEVYSFLDRAVLEPLMKIGVLDARQLADLKRTGQHYVPYMRLIRESIHKIGGDEAVQTMLKAEDEVAKKFFPGQEFRSTRVLPEGKPIKEMRGGGLQLDDPIGDPIQAIAIRVQSLHKFVSAQMVRNQLGDLLDKVGPKAVPHTSTKIPKAINKLRKGSPENLVTVWREGKEIAYVVEDKTLAQSVASLSSSQMGLLQKIVESPMGSALTFPTRLFRAGVVMGLEFMFRNPGRDQFTAALFSRYGYIPGWDFMKGLWQTITRGEDWEQFHKAGTGMANFNSLDIHRAEVDLSLMLHDKTLGQLRREVRMGTFEGVPKATDYLKASLNSMTMAVKKAFTSTGRAHLSGHWLQKTGQAINIGANAAVYGLGRISELAEQSTRVGNFMRARKRAKAGKGYGWLFALDKAAGGIRTPWNYFKPKIWRKAREYINNPTRMGAWMGDTREVALDFSRRGYTGEVLNGLYAFANAEFQDLARFARAMDEAPLNTVIKGFSLLTVPAIANWYLNFDDPRYQMQNEAERALFMHPWGYDEAFGKFARISRPIGVPGALFSYGAEKMLDELFYRYPQGIKALEEMMWPGISDSREIRNLFQEKAYDITGQMGDWANLGMMLSTAPIGMVGLLRRAGKPGEKVEPVGPPDHRGEFGGFMGNFGPMRFFNSPLDLFPQAVQPLAEIAANEDAFFGGTVVPTREIMRPRDPADVKNPYTSPIEEQVAAAFRTVGNFLPGDVDWLRKMNPMQAGFLMRRYTGSVGNMALAGADALAQQAGLFSERPGMPPNMARAPLVKGFYGRSPYGPNSQPTIDFYEKYEEAMLALNTVQDRVQAKNAQGAVQYIEDNPEIAAAKFMRAVSAEISEGWKLRREIMDDRTISDEMREAQIMVLDQALTQQMIYANDIYDSIKEEFELWLH